MNSISLEMKFGQEAVGMDWLEFIAAMTTAIAWPLAAVIIALVFRKQLSLLIDKIRKFTWGDTSLDFSEQLDEAENVVSQISEEENIVQAPSDIPDDRFSKLLEISPSAAILDAWIPVEQSLKQIGQELGYDQSKNPRLLSVSSHLLRSHKISGPTYELIREMQKMRNLAAHETDVSKTDALRFLDISRKVMKILNQV